VVNRGASVWGRTAPFARRAYLNSAALNAGLLAALSEASPQKVFSGRSEVVARSAHASLPSVLRRGC